MNKARHVIGLLWSWLVKLFNCWLPDAPLTMRYRGWLYGLMMRDKGGDFQVASSATIKGLENLTVGRNCYLAPGSLLLCGTEVVLEDEVMLGPYVVIVTGNHGSLQNSFRFAYAGHDPIRIGAGSWLGAHVTVTAGVSIGRGSLIGANAVVTSDVPDGVFAAGVPARVIGPISDLTSIQKMVK